MKKLFAIVCFLALVTVFSAPVSSDAAVKTGQSCSKAGRIVTVQKVTYQCKKKAGKLVWLKAPQKPTLPNVQPTTLPSAFEFNNPAGDPAKTCRYLSGAQWVTSFGFPKSARSLPSIGKLKGLMVFVNFTDIKGTDDPKITGPAFTTKFEKFYEQQSYGKLKIDTEIYPDYLTIPKSSSSYGMNKWGGGNPADYWVDGLSAVSKFRTLSEYDFVVVMPPNTVRDIIYGPSFPGWSPNQFAGLKAHFGGAVGGADQRNKEGSTGWIWLSHEIGHTMGFEHQYGYYPQPIWDLMDNVYIDTAPGLFGWHRFMQGWLEDKSVICLPMLVDGSTQKLQISPLEGMSESPKLALIKFDSASLYGVEYRLKSEFDKLPEEAEGVLIYRISPTVGSNQNALRLLKTAGPKSQSGQIYGTLKVGEQISSGSLNFKITKASSAGAEIEISR